MSCNRKARAQTGYIGGIIENNGGRTFSAIGLFLPVILVINSANLTN